MYYNTSRRASRGSNRQANKIDNWRKPLAHGLRRRFRYIILIRSRGACFGVMHAAGHLGSLSPTPIHPDGPASLTRGSMPVRAERIRRPCAHHLARLANPRRRQGLVRWQKDPGQGSQTRTGPRDPGWQLFSWRRLRREVSPTAESYVGIRVWLDSAACAMTSRIGGPGPESEPQHALRVLRARPMGSVLAL